jgi:hypothetical protein
MGIASLTDRLAVWWQGGVRVRILKGGPRPEGAAVGGIKGLSGDEALQLVFELAPDAPGVIDIQAGEAGLWRVKVGGPLASGHFDQRVRNVLAAR